MKKYMENIAFYFLNRDWRKQKALEAFSKAIRDYLFLVVTVGPVAVRESVVTKYGSLVVDNKSLYWEDFRFIDNGMAPSYKQYTDTPQPYGNVRFDFFGTKYSRYFVRYLYQYLLEEGYEINLYSGGYYLTIFVSTDKIYGTKPFPFLPLELDHVR